jgi:precorrin-6Y C5,15-methyltransferase (decarboxylating)
VSVVGVSGDGVGGLGAAAWRAVTDAEVVFGDRRLLEGAASRLRAGPVGAGTATSTAPELVEVTDREDACRRVAATSGDGRAACLLTRGDPGFFGIVRPLLRVVDRRYLRVVPAPSTVALAFARLGLPWDDAAVVALGVGSLADAVRSIRLARKAAVLTTPGAPPEAVGRALVDARAAVDMVAVCSRMGLEDESVTVIGLDQLATGVWDPHSVVVLLGPAGRPIAGWGGADHRDRPLAWGLPDSAFGLPDGPVPAAEVRAVVLGKLAIPPAGVLWDVGGGSGGVAVEAVSLCPGLTAFAVESEDDAAARITELAVRRGADVKVVHGPIPTACDGLPDPDRVFVGGGGLDVLDAALARLRPGGRVVAAFDALDRATAAADRLGHLVQVSVGRGRPLDDGGWRLGADDPAFVAWGPDPDGPAR